MVRCERSEPRTARVPEMRRHAAFDIRSRLAAARLAPQDEVVALPSCASRCRARSRPALPCRATPLSTDPGPRFSKSARHRSPRGQKLNPIRPPMVKGILLGFLAMAIFSCGDAAMKAIGDRMTVFEIVVLRDALRLRRASLRAPAARALARHVPDASAGSGDGAHCRGRPRRRLQHPGLHDTAVRRGLFADLSVAALRDHSFDPVPRRDGRVAEGARDPDRLCRRAARGSAGFSRADAGASRCGGRVALRRRDGAGAPRARADREAHHADGRGLRRGDRLQRRDHAVRLPAAGAARPVCWRPLPGSVAGRLTCS